MAAFDSLQKASFDGVAFPVESCDVIGGLRDHVHEYPHTDGGAPEKMGRKLYTIRMVCPFHTTFRAYPNLWPQALDTLRAKFERGLTKDLVIPTIGTIQAYCVNWSQHMVAKVRSGERVELEFREDQPDTFLVLSIIKVSVQTLDSQFKTFEAAAEEDGIDSLDAFDSIKETVNSVTSVIDQIDLADSRFEAKIQSVTNACQSLDNSLPDLDKPPFYKSLDALHDLWDTSAQLHKDILKRALPTIPFVVPMLMTVSDVSRALYGDTSHAVEIMKLNAIENCFQIQPGTVLRVYAPFAIKLASAA